ncbi:GIY-YIG nuclease family protein [bacterium]|nr:GIY-YIG nuclease family protein [bacterium]
MLILTILLTRDKQRLLGHFYQEGFFIEPCEPLGGSAFFIGVDLIIYKVTNIITNKVYIGQTIQKLHARRSDHIRKAIKYNSKIYFHNALRKYGIDNFKWEIIDISDNVEKLYNKEKYWIKYFNSTNKNIGYNMTTGGDHYVFSKEIRKKIGLAGLGRKKSQEEKELMRHRMLGANNHLYGKKLSEETKKKISESRKGKGLGQTELQKLKCPHFGSSNGNSVINNNIAKEIKIMLKKGYRSIDIQKHFNISKSIVYSIRKNTTWKHIVI